MAWGAWVFGAAVAAEAANSSWAQKQCGPLGSIQDYDESVTQGHRGHAVNALPGNRIKKCSCSNSSPAAVPLLTRDSVTLVFGAAHGKNSTPFTVIMRETAPILKGHLQSELND